MIGMVVRAVARGAVSGGPPRQGPPKEWSTGGKAVFWVLFIGGIIAMHWWVQALCILAALAVVTLPIVFCALADQREKREQPDELDQIMRAWENDR